MLDHEGGRERDPLQCRLGLRPETALDPGQGEMAVERRAAPGRLRQHRRRGPPHRFFHGAEPLGGKLEDPDRENQAVAGPSRHRAGPGRAATPARSASPRGSRSASVTSPRKRSVTCQRADPTSRRFFSRPSSSAARRWRVGSSGHAATNVRTGWRGVSRHPRRAHRRRSGILLAMRPRRARAPDGP